MSNTQYQKFVRATKYKTEAENFQWSFVLESLASEEVVKEVDGEDGYGRVKEAPHWMAVKGAYWRRPEGYISLLCGCTCSLYLGIYAIEKTNNFTCCMAYHIVSFSLSLLFLPLLDLQ